MRNSYRGRPKSRWPQKTSESKTVQDVLKELKPNISPAGSYRERSLKINGLICAKCGVEFDRKTMHLLTVHHKDGNSRNNPPDGSNWENLCVYCHEDEHSRELLGDYLSNQEGKNGKS